VRGLCVPAAESATTWSGGGGKLTGRVHLGQRESAGFSRRRLLRGIENHAVSRDGGDSETFTTETKKPIRSAPQD